MRSDKVLFIRQEDGSFIDAATGAAAPDVMASGLRPVRMNNAVRGAIDAALGSLRLFAPDAAIRLAAAEAVFQSHDPAALPALERAMAKETDAGVKQRMEQARAAALLASADAAASTIVLPPSPCLRARGDIDSRSLLAGLTGQPPAVAAAAAGRDHRDRPTPAALEHRAERLLRSFAWLGAAAGGGGAGDHLRRHGRDQHGARRDGDDRRLRDLHGAAGDPRQRARPVRRQPADRRPAGVRRGRTDRHRHRAHADPLAVRQAAGDTAGDLGAVADPAAGGALDLRRQQPRCRHAGLDERRNRARRPDAHLQSAVHHPVRVPGAGGADGRAALHLAGPARCAR